MNIFFLTASGFAATGGTLILKKKGKIDGEKIKADGRSTLLTGVATTATVIGAQLVEKEKMDEIRQKYSAAYVESATTDQLEAADRQLEAMLAEFEENAHTATDTKTHVKSI